MVEPTLLRTREVAVVLGLSRSKVAQLVSANRLPGIIRIGRSVRIEKSALEAWIKDQAEAAERQRYSLS